MPAAARAGAAAMQGARRTRGYLLDYANASFSRSSEAAAVDPRDGWAFYSLVTPWPGVDVPRILPDGAILVEGSRTNLVQHNRQPNQAPWTSFAGKVTADDGDGPDGATIADRIQTASGAVGCDQALSGTGDFTASLFVKEGAGGAGTYQMLLWAGADLAAVGGSAPANWERVSVFNNVASAPNVRLAEGNDRSGVGGIVAGARDSLVDLAQVEAAAYASSPIRTQGATATRALEKPSFLGSEGSPWPERLNSGKFAIDVWPSWSSADAPAGQFAYILANGNSDVFYLYKNAGTLEVRLQAASVNVIAAFGITFSAHQKLTFTIDWPGQELTLDGATTGDATVAISASDFTIASHERLAIGHSATTAGREFNGVIGRPRAA